MAQTLRPLAATLLLAALAGPAVAQQPLFFDAFLLDNGGQPAQNLPGQSPTTPNGFFLWNVSAGTVNLSGGSVPGVDDPSDGGRFVDLGGAAGDPGRFETKLPLTFAAGAAYTLSFRYAKAAAGGGTNAATVSIGSQAFGVSSDTTAFQTFSREFSFADATTATLAFQDLGPGGTLLAANGLGIDTVMVVPVPEPTTALAVGAVALAGVRRLRRGRA